MAPPPPPPPQGKPNQTYRSRSDESLKQRFSPEYWSDFNRPDANYFDIPTTANANASRKTSPAARARASSKTQDTPLRPSYIPTTNIPVFGVPGFPSFPPPPPGPPPNLNTQTQPQAQAQAQGRTSPQPAQFPPPTTPGGVRFSDNDNVDWSHVFKPVPQPTFPSKPSSPIKRKPRPPLKAGGEGSVPLRPFVAEVEDEEKGGKRASSVSADDEDSPGDAMDLDDELPGRTNGFATERAKEPRSVPIIPHRPEWRDSAPYAPVPPMPPSPPSTTQESRPPFPAAPAAAAAPPPPAPEPNPLYEFRNVEPFAPPSSNGLNGMKKDFDNVLPFPSAPSASHPLMAEQEKAIDLPRVPRAPELQGKLTTERWNQHYQATSFYFTEWVRFQSQMLTHFAQRQANMERLKGTAWLSFGEAAGFEPYMRALQEDVVYHVHWTTAFEKHVVAMENFEKLRERVQKGGLRSEI